jgi:hypothetical protein
MKLTEIVLTRYLYNKVLVVESLKISIQEKNLNKSLFWGYELYYSGFQTELFDLLFSLCQDIEIRDFCQNKYNLHPNDETLVYLILKNMISFKINVNNQFVGYRILPKCIDNFKNKTFKTHQFLQKTCIYSVEKRKMLKKGKDKLRNLFRENWLYYASFSPIWKSRIADFGGKISKKKVIFNEDVFDEFHNKYNYEPCEQSIYIIDKCMGL